VPDADPFDDDKESTMARPKIGFFGALVALGGFLAVRHLQRNRAAQVSAARDLSRWEGEGGAEAPAASSGSVTAGAGLSTPHTAHGANGPVRSNGKDGAWPFPRG
jgi:hypothetical protein